MDKLLVNAVSIWASAAILLLILELLKTNGYALWLSVSAAIVASLKAWLTPLSLSYQLITFGILSLILCLWWFRSLKQKPVQLNKLKAKEHLGQVYTLKKAVKHGKGQLDIADLIWFVHSEQDLPKATRVKVKGTNGAVLLIEEYTDTST